MTLKDYEQIENSINGGILLFGVRDEDRKPIGL